MIGGNREDRNWQERAAPAAVTPLGREGALRLIALYSWWAF